MTPTQIVGLLMMGTPFLLFLALSFWAVGFRMTMQIVGIVLMSALIGTVVGVGALLLFGWNI